MLSVEISCAIIYCLLKQFSQLTTMAMRNFRLKIVKKLESYRDVSILDTLTSEQYKEDETLTEQYPDVLSS